MLANKLHENEQVPFVTALCPTYRHPDLLANSLALWLAQDYPLDRRELVILDDGQSFDNQNVYDLHAPSSHPGWRLHSAPQRLPSLPDKYNVLLRLARPETEIFLVWEDDDYYSHSYCSQHVNVLLGKPQIDGYTNGFARYSRQPCEFSKPSRVLSDYAWEDRRFEWDCQPSEISALQDMVESHTCRCWEIRKAPQEEAAGGRFHSSMAFTADLIRRIGGWPMTHRADFDQQLLNLLSKEAVGIADPWDPANPSYVYGWQTGSAHCQSTMRSPSDETWYARGEQAYKEVGWVGQLLPKLDERTKKIMRALGHDYSRYPGEELGQYTCECGAPYRPALEHNRGCKRKIYFFVDQAASHPDHYGGNPEWGIGEEAEVRSYNGHHYVWTESWGGLWMPLDWYHSRQDASSKEEVVQ